MRRLGPLLLGTVGAAAFTVLLTGDAGALGAGVGAAAVAFLAWLAAARRRRRRGARSEDWSPVGRFTFTPAAAHSPSSPGAVAGALSRVEARELASSASVGVGVGFSLMVLVLFGVVWAGDYRGGLAGAMEIFPIETHPLAGMVVLGAHRARTRSRRDDTDELFEACATPQSTRTAGHLLSAWAPAAIALVYLLLLTGLLSRGTLDGWNTIGGRQVGALAGSALLCVGATALGVMLARWAPWRLVPVVAVIGVGFLAIRLATAGDGPYEPIRQLSTMLNDPDAYVRFTAPHWLAHHLWILSLVAAVSLLALARDLRTRRVLTAGALIACAAVVSAVAATRPMDTTDAQRIAALIDDPVGHQSCIDAAGLPVCSYAHDDALTRRYAEHVEPVVRAAPAGALADWSIRRDTKINRSHLDPAVLERLRTDGDDRRFIPIDQFSQHDHAVQGALLWVALTAVGVTDEVVDGGAVRLDRQARGVLALWLATRGADNKSADQLTSTQIETHDSGNYVSSSWRPWPDRCYAGPAPATWAYTDVDAARLLTRLPDAAVRQLVLDRWDQLIDPATTTADLLALAGVKPPPARPGSTEGGGEC